MVYSNSGNVEWFDKQLGQEHIEVMALSFVISHLFVCFPCCQRVKEW